MTIEQAQEPPLDWTNAYRAAPTSGIETDRERHGRESGYQPDAKLARCTVGICVGLRIDGWCGGPDTQQFERERDNWDKRRSSVSRGVSARDQARRASAATGQVAGSWEQYEFRAQ